MALTPPSAVGSSRDSLQLSGQLGLLPIENIIGGDLRDELEVFLRKKPSEITAIDQDGRTLLIRLAQANAKGCLLLLLEQHLGAISAQMTLADKKGRSALHYLCANAKPLKAEEVGKDAVPIDKLVGRILAAVPTAYGKDCDGWTPLHYVVSHQNFDLMKQFYFHKLGSLSVEEHDVIFQEGTFTPLHAAACGEFNTLMYVSGLTERVNVRDDKGMTSLHHVMRSKIWEKNLALFIENKAQLDVMDRYGRTPMSFALQLGNLGAAGRLLDEGADPGIGEPNPLMQAYINGWIDFAKKIIAKKTTAPEVLTFLLELATSRNEEPAFIELLIANESKVTPTVIALRKAKTMTGGTSQKCGQFSLSQIKKGEHTALKPNDPEKNSHLHQLVLGEIDYELLRPHTKDWDLKNAQNETPLLYCARVGSVPSVIQLLAFLAKHSKKSIVAQDKDGNSIMHRALLVRNQVLFYYLVTQHPELVNVANANGDTPLLLATRMGDRLAVATLLKNGANPKAVDREGNNALHGISEAASDQVQRLAILDLLAKQVHLEAENKLRKRPLLHAWERLNTLVFHRLLELKAQPDVVDSADSTLLMRVCEQGKLEDALKLVQAGADRNAKGKAMTPLLAAVIPGHVDLARLLLDKTVAAGKGKVKVAHPNRGLPHMTPLTAAINGLHHSLTAKDCSEKNPLLHPHYKIIQMLLTDGADANKAVKVSASMEINPLTLAVEKGLLEVVRLLLDHKAKPNNKAHGEKARSPIVVAIQKGHIEIANLLKEKGAKVSDEMQRELEKKMRERKVIQAVSTAEVEGDEYSDQSENSTAVQSAAASAYSSQTITPRGSPRSRGRYIVPIGELTERLRALQVQDSVNGFNEQS